MQTRKLRGWSHLHQTVSIFGEKTGLRFLCILSPNPSARQAIHRRYSASICCTNDDGNFRKPSISQYRIFLLHNHYINPAPEKPCETGRVGFVGEKKAREHDQDEEDTVSLCLSQVGIHMWETRRCKECDVCCTHSLSGRTPGLRHLKREPHTDSSQTTHIDPLFKTLQRCDFRNLPR